VLSGVHGYSCCCRTVVSGSWRLGHWSCQMGGSAVSMNSTALGSTIVPPFTRPWNSRPSVWLRCVGGRVGAVWLRCVGEVGCGGRPLVWLRCAGGRGGGRPSVWLRCVGRRGGMRGQTISVAKSGGIWGRPSVWLRCVGGRGRM
jgi:hypothetical protein